MNAVSAEGEAERTDSADAQWRRLDRRTVLVSGVWAAGVAVAAGVPTGIGIAQGTSVGVALLWVLPAAVLVVVGGLVLEEIYWRHARYRVLPDVVEFVSGIVVRRRRALQRERVRVVDLTAEPVTRLAGLTKVTIGTGEQGGSGGSGQGSIVLRAVPRAAGDALRAELLTHAAATRTEPGEGRLAELDRSWVRYAPVSFLTPLLGLSAAGAVMQVAQWFGAESGVIDWVMERFTGWPWPAAVAVLLVLSQVVGVIAAGAIFVEMWWHYRLDREPGGTLRVRRGLFTTRSISIDEDRLRGVEIVEPLGFRLSGAARVDVIATGMGSSAQDQQTDRRTLLPAAPSELTRRVAASILREPTLPSDAVTLAPHPVTARRRRVRWALSAVAAFEIVLVVLGLWLTDVLLHVAWISALVAVPGGVWWAFDAYRSLGHGLTGDYLVTRSGSVRRASVLLQRRGMVGWTVRRSFFQRRAGLVTLTATTAAGNGGYRVVDVGESEGLAFAETAMPHLIPAFLERAGR